MLAFDAPNLGKCCNANAFKFWHLPISKDFDKPEYYIGQTVLHRIEVRQGEILHPVQVIGIAWTGGYWQYEVSLSKDHPWFEVRETEAEWLDENELEPM